MFAPCTHQIWPAWRHKNQQATYDSSTSFWNNRKREWVFIILVIIIMVIKKWGLVVVPLNPWKRSWIVSNIWNSEWIRRRIILFELFLKNTIFSFEQLTPVSTPNPVIAPSPFLPRSRLCHWTNTDYLVGRVCSWFSHVYFSRLLSEILGFPPKSRNLYFCNTRPSLDHGTGSTSAIFSKYLRTQLIHSLILFTWSNCQMVRRCHVIQSKWGLVELDRLEY